MVRAIGMDVHRDFCEVAIAQGGQVRSAGQIKATPEALELFAASLSPSDVVVLEVTGNAGEIARILRPHVGAVVVVSPHDTGINRARAGPGLRVTAGSQSRGRPRSVRPVRCARSTSACARAAARRSPVVSA